MSISSHSNISASSNEGVTKGTLSLNKHPRNASRCLLCMWLRGKVVSNHDSVTYDIVPLRLSVCLRG